MCCASMAVCTPKALLCALRMHGCVLTNSSVRAGFHHDLQHNFYLLLNGTKHFLLRPPPSLSSPDVAFPLHHPRHRWHSMAPTLYALACLCARMPHLRCSAYMCHRQLQRLAAEVPSWSATLHSNDVLYIPPLVTHSGAVLSEAGAVAVSLCSRSLEKTSIAALSHTPLPFEGHWACSTTHLALLLLIARVAILSTLQQDAAPPTYVADALMEIHTAAAAEAGARDQADGCVCEQPQPWAVWGGGVQPWAVGGPLGVKAILARIEPRAAEMAAVIRTLKVQRGTEVAQLVYAGLVQEWIAFFFGSSGSHEMHAVGTGAESRCFLASLRRWGADPAVAIRKALQAT